MRKSPSLSQLISLKPCLATAATVKVIWAESTSRKLAQAQIGALLDMDVEYLGRHRRNGEHVYYLNRGSPYKDTLLFIGDTLRTGCWGDLIETRQVLEYEHQ